MIRPNYSSEPCSSIHYRFIVDGLNGIVGTEQRGQAYDQWTASQKESGHDSTCSTKLDSVDCANTWGNRTSALDRIYGIAHLHGLREEAGLGLDRPTRHKLGNSLGWLDSCSQAKRARRDDRARTRPG